MENDPAALEYLESLKKRKMTVADNFELQNDEHLTNEENFEDLVEEDLEKLSENESDEQDVYQNRKQMEILSAHVSTAIIRSNVKLSTTAIPSISSAEKISMSSSHLKDHSPSCCEECRLNGKSMVILLEKQNEMLIDISNQLRSKKTVSEQNQLDFLMLPNFPMNTATVIIAFDKNLSHPKLRSQFKVFMSRLGGNNAKDFLRRTMAKFVTNHVAKQFSWTGSSENSIAVNLMKFPDVIKGVVEENVPTTTEYNIQKWIAEWLRRCTDRIAAEENKQKNRQKNASSAEIDFYKLIY